jgi:N-acyl-L-homoserine lactone synthetase
MACLIDAANRAAHDELLRAMYRDRKAVFVDRLGWRLNVRDGLETDRFDHAGAEYLILRERATGDHMGSLRLLRTDQPHLLDSMFPDLCDGDIPRGPAVREISRLCLSPRYPPSFFADYRAHLATALVEFGLLRGVHTYTAVIEAGNLGALLSRGWQCRPLGAPRRYGPLTLIAVEVRVDARSIELLRRAGNYREHSLDCPAGLEALAA